MSYIFSLPKKNFNSQKKNHFNSIHIGTRVYFSVVHQALKKLNNELNQTSAIK